MGRFSLFSSGSHHGTGRLVGGGACCYVCLPHLTHRFPTVADLPTRIDVTSRPRSTGSTSTAKTTSSSSKTPRSSRVRPPYTWTVGLRSEYKSPSDDEHVSPCSLANGVPNPPAVASLPRRPWHVLKARLQQHTSPYRSRSPELSWSLRPLCFVSAVETMYSILLYYRQVPRGGELQRVHRRGSIHHVRADLR